MRELLLDVTTIEEGWVQTLLDDLRTLSRTGSAKRATTGGISLATRSGKLRIDVPKRSLGPIESMTHATTILRGLASDVAGARIIHSDEDSERAGHEVLSAWQNVETVLHALNPHDIERIRGFTRSPWRPANLRLDVQHEHDGLECAPGDDAVAHIMSDAPHIVRVWINGRAAWTLSCGFAYSVEAETPDCMAAMRLIADLESAGVAILQ